MRVALTGSSGFIGAAIAHQLHHHGHRVTGLLRESSARSHVDEVLDRVVIGSQESPEMVDPLLADADALIHNSVDWRVLQDDSLDHHVEVNLTASLRLFSAAAKMGIPVVFISSVAVHHHMRDRWQGTIDEDHPTRPGNYYGALKASLEAHLWALHTSDQLSFVSLRPAAVYGIDPQLKRSIGFPIVRALASKQAYHRAGGGKFIHVDDVAASAVAALAHPEITCGIYHLADCYARWGDVASMIAEHLGIEASIDLDSPHQPRNMFELDSIRRDLGLPMDRGLDGLRTYLGELVTLMKDQDLL